LTILTFAVPELLDLIWWKIGFLPGETSIAPYNFVAGGIIILCGVYFDYNYQNHVNMPQHIKIKSKKINCFDSLVLCFSRETPSPKRLYGLISSLFEPYIAHFRHAIFNITPWRRLIIEGAFIDPIIILFMFMLSFIFCDNMWSFWVEANLCRFFFIDCNLFSSWYTCRWKNPH
jgi:hypothetical protein